MILSSFFSCSVQLLPHLPIPVPIFDRRGFFFQFFFFILCYFHKDYIRDVWLTLCLRNELSNATDGLDLLLSLLAEVLGLDNGGLGELSTLGEDLEVTLQS